MTAVLRDLGLWFWRLVPANPILVRVVYAGGRRQRHLYIRIGYLAVMFVVLVIGVVSAGQGTSASSLADLAKSATGVFKLVAMVQLFMVCLLAPIFAAAAITQEKDSNTYAILLTTPLSNAQIVFGSLLSRMYFVFVLLLAGLPLFCLMMVYGGVTAREIALSSALAASSGLVAGALAIAISVMRVGTRKTIFTFYFIVAFYLMALWSIKGFNAVIPVESMPAPGGTARMSWLAAFHPFLALWAVINATPAPAFGAVAHYGRPWNWLLAYPAQSYIVMTTITSVLVCLVSLSFVRAGSKEGEPTWYNRLFRRTPSDKDAVLSASKGPDERTRRIRHVWDRTGKSGKWFGAVAWREAMTRASGGGRAVQRISVVAVGVLAAAVLLYYYATGLSAPLTRTGLSVMISIELGLALLVATNTAATALTREKEGGTLDILLLSPLVSKDILWGKIVGLVLFTAPMLVIPLLSLLMFVGYDLVRSKSEFIVHPELLLTLPLVMIAFSAAACMNGLWFSITKRKTVQAVIASVAVLLAACGVLSCGFLLADSSAMLGAVAMPFGPITSVLVAINPERWLDTLSSGGVTTANDYRGISAVSSLVAAVVWWLVGMGVYRRMVQQFDMIIRKQTT